MSNIQKSLLKFPCQFSLKVMVNNTIAIDHDIKPIIKKYVADSTIDISSRKSRTGKYIAITITFQATSKTQLDNIYSELTTHKKVLMAL